MTGVMECTSEEEMGPPEAWVATVDIVWVPALLPVALPALCTLGVSTPAHCALLSAAASSSLQDQGVELVTQAPSCAS